MRGSVFGLLWWIRKGLRPQNSDELKEGLLSNQAAAMALPFHLPLVVPYSQPYHLSSITTFTSHRSCFPKLVA